MSLPYSRLLMGVLLGAVILIAACIPPELLSRPFRSETAERLYKEAESLYQAHRYAEAQNSFEQYLRTYPQGQHRRLVMLRTAEISGIRGNWSKARSRYEKLLESRPESPLAWQARYGIGQSYFKQGQYQQALQVLEGLTASNLNPELRFKTNALLAELALKTGNVSQAFVRLQLANQNLAFGDVEWFQDIKTRLVEQAQPPELVRLAELYSNEPLSAALLLQLVRLELQKGHLETAREWLNTLMQRFPNSPETAMAAEWLGPESTTFIAPQNPALGCLLPLTGDYEAVGRRVRQGMELAADQTKVELIFEDCQNSPSLAAQAVDALSQNQRILAVLGPLTSATAKAAAQAAQRQGLPIVTLTQKADITAIGDLVFRDFLTSRMQVKALLTYMVVQRGIRRYAILYPESAYGQTFRRLFDEEIVSQGGLLVSQVSYPEGTQYFSGVIATLAEAYQPSTGSTPAFEALFVPDEPSEVAALASQLKSSPLAGIQLLGTNLIHSSHTLQTAAASLEGILFPDAFFPQDSNPEVQAFVQAFQTRYQQTPQYLAAQGYSAVKLLADLLHHHPGLTRRDLAQRLGEWQPGPGLPWFQGFDFQREAQLDIKILTIRDGQFELVQ
ncbi:MAG: penicillin-binding protein activator [Deltaproteobacteria bacterium]|nr:penicillin-binding protein activator [Deltaproteobacteria bacterium]MBW1952429.1 penicillin-binding protein activator [Deltaproteobacteria bacterium]MBW1986673.1 penicillin-binding protein activator [Deltaproteobacteria bacterium]MBW2134881.1 penicillin-binding protein activator [Deltaproteobacteria bacterium]